MVALWAKSGSIIGPDGNEYPRGGTNAANGNVFYDFGGGGGAAQQVAGTGATLDSAWWQFVFDQYPDGGLFIAGPTKAGHENGPYFAVDGGNFCNVPFGNVRVICSRNTQFRISDLLTSSRVFQINGKEGFHWEGGTFNKIGAASVTGQSFFLALGAAHRLRIEGARFHIQSTNAALNNFYCISVTGPSSSLFSACLHFPEIIDCEVSFASVEQTTAMGAFLGASTLLSNTYFGGSFLKLFNVRGAKVRGLRAWADEEAVDRFSGPIINAANEEGTDYDDIVIWGMKTRAADATASDLFISGDQLGVGEGSHVQVRGLKIHTAAARYGLHLVNPLYSSVDGVEIGRLSAWGAIFAGPLDGVAGSGRELSFDGLKFHNNNPLANAVGVQDVNELNTADAIKVHNVIGWNVGRITATYFTNNRKLLCISGSSGELQKDYRYNVREWSVNGQAAATIFEHPVRFLGNVGRPAIQFNQRPGSTLRRHRDVEA